MDGDVHTQTIEGVWSLVKRGIGGVYHSVSAKHLQSYLDEYAFRYSHRSDARSMFDSMLDALVEGTSSAPSPREREVEQVGVHLAGRGILGAAIGVFVRLGTSPTIGR